MDSAFIVSSVVANYSSFYYPPYLHHSSIVATITVTASKQLYLFTVCYCSILSLLQPFFGYY